MFSSKLFTCLKNANPRVFIVLSFLIPLIVRGLPEILMGKHIMGFDTISYYIPVTLKWTSGEANVVEFMAYAPLFYTLLSGLTLIGVPLTVSLKLLPSVLHGLLGFTIYLYATKALKWSYEKSLFASCLATLYFVALRVSWDMLRNELGLIFLFVFLTFLSNSSERNSWKNYLKLLSCMILIVLTHQLVTAVMFAVLFAFMIQKLSNHEHVAARNLVLSAAPALILSASIIYAEFMSSTSFSIVNGFQSNNSGTWLSMFGFASYFDMAAYNLGFLFYSYLPLLPFLVFGIKRFKNLEMKTWLLFCSLMPVSSIFSPYAYRWTLMLIFPTTFFVVKSFEKLDSRRWKKLLGGVLILLTSSFILLPSEIAFPYFAVFSSYIPSSMLQNTVPLQDCKDVEAALSWVRDNASQDGILLVHDAFHGWALLSLNRNQVVCYGFENPEKAASDLFRNGDTRLFLVWWTPSEGWHGLPTLPPCFEEVFRSNRIAVYAYNASSVA